MTFAVGPALSQRRRHRGGVEAPGVRRVYGDDVRRASSRAWPWAPSAIVWEPHSTLYGMYMPDSSAQQQPRQRPQDHGHAQEHNGARRTWRRASKIIFDIQRYAAEQQYYVYLYCVRHHRLLAAICEELWPQPQLRLRQSRRGAVAGPIGEERVFSREGHQHETVPP